MRRRVGSAFLLVAALHGRPIAAQQVPATASVRGVVRDSSGAPIPGASVRVRGKDVVTTNERGQFLIPGIDGGSHIVTVLRVGYAPESLSVRFVAGDTAEGLFVLRATTYTLPEVGIVVTPQVSSRLEGFEHRRSNRNGGQFITRDQIERRGSIGTADLLRGVQGIQVVDSMGTPIAISSRGAKVNMLSVKRVEACVVRVGVDGNVTDPTFSINTIPPSDIHGIEVYAGAATIPPEFNSTAGRNAQCGLIMIWTRSR